MKYLSNNEENKALKYIDEAIKIAKKSTCERSKCGSVIVRDNVIIGCGFNSSPQNLKGQKRCLINKNSYHKKVTDKTCCVHAEQRAIMDALRKNPAKLSGSTLYFIRLDKEDKILKAKEPYCTICSKMALDVEIDKFVLWHDEGVGVYDTEEYNILSFEYCKEKEE